MLCCAVLYCAMLCCAVLYCAVLYCAVLYCAACCAVLRCTVLCCDSCETVRARAAVPVSNHSLQADQEYDNTRYEVGFHEVNILNITPRSTTILT
jgi:hypothetical protein